MTTHELVATLRQGAPVTSRLVREIIIHLERIPALERTIKAKDHDFTQLSVAYSAVTSRAESTVPFTRDECGYVCEALEESERLKEAVAWMVECDAVKKWIVFDCECFFGDNTEEITESAAFAREMVGRMI